MHSLSLFYLCIYAACYSGFLSDDHAFFWLPWHNFFSTVWMCKILNQKSQTALKRTGKRTFPERCCIFLKVWAANRRHTALAKTLHMTKKWSVSTQNMFAPLVPAKHNKKSLYYWFSHIAPVFHQHPNEFECTAILGGFFLSGQFKNITMKFLIRNRLWLKLKWSRSSVTALYAQLFPCMPGHHVLSITCASAKMQYARLHSDITVQLFYISELWNVEAL